MAEGLQALTEKEKETLRLVVRGYDAKSMARHLGLSVHTINERLRYARRKLEVSTSREAGRLLLAQEGADPQWLGSKELGDASSRSGDQDGRRKAGALLAWVLGGLAMSLIAATILLASFTHAGAPREGAALAPAAVTDRSTLANSPEVAVALRWLALVDSSQWDASYAATGDAFRKLNTAAGWTTVSEKGRVPLGKVISRTPASEETVHAPPSGYQMVKFETRFANRPSALETVTLSREGGEWKVVGYWID
jgi:DNA-binding CsgD family transcriptional regulator